MLLLVEKIAKPIHLSYFNIDKYIINTIKNKKALIINKNVNRNDRLQHKHTIICLRSSIHNIECITHLTNEL